jgi:feruloyl esterase
VFIGLSITILPAIYGQRQNIESSEPCMPCKELMDQQFTDVRITSTEDIVEGNPHCRILGVIGNEIKFELLLPDQWNGRYIMGGGGGFVGSIWNRARSSINEGYATSGTDTGHEGKTFEGDWALNNMERQLNYSYLAVHRTAIVSKAIISKYYNLPPKFSYFIGCSKGGEQALKEAQRYPDDFDGIVAGAPSIDVPALLAKCIQISKIVFPDPDNLKTGIISESQVNILHEAILKQCDSLDGIKDNILSNPPDCTFDFSELPICKEGTEDETCFTAEQIEAIKMIYTELVIQGEKVYPEYTLGSEGGWWEWVIGPGEGPGRFNSPTYGYAIGRDYFRYLIFNDPEWDFYTYDFYDYFRDTKYAAANYNANSTNYREFKENGSKLIIFHGWNDPGVSPNASIDYYEAVKKKDPETESYFKLFLLPGVYHCGGGPGPSQVNWIDIIRDWVENGNPPDRIIVSKREDARVIMTRPVYPYPNQAVYKGIGDPNDESSFIKK